MGYYITTSKPDEEIDIIHTDLLLATDEEVRVAELAFSEECGGILETVKQALRENIASRIYKRHLVYYIREAQNWMCTSTTIYGPGYRPHETEEAVRCIFTRAELSQAVADFQAGKELLGHEYFIYQMPDEEVIENRQKYERPPYPLPEDELIPVGTAAFHLINYEKILPVTVKNRIGFLYYCEAEDGHPYVMPSHQLFRTEGEARAKIDERNTRRDAAIEKYHLLDSSEDATVNHDRMLALEWLHYNQDPPELLEEKLERSSM